MDASVGAAYSHDIDHGRLHDALNPRGKRFELVDLFLLDDVPELDLPSVFTTSEYELVDVGDWMRHEIEVTG